MEAEHIHRNIKRALEFITTRLLIKASHNIQYIANDITNIIGHYVLITTGNNF